MSEENKFTQLCVWQGTSLGDDSVEDFEKFVLEHMKGRILFQEEVETLPDMDNGKPVPNTGGRTDLFFYVHSDDIPTFSIKRLAYGVRWWEDVLGNGNAVLYSQDILDKYKNTWE